MGNEKKTSIVELSEDELVNAAGGRTENRYDAKICPTIKWAQARCHKDPECDHYRRPVTVDGRSVRVIESCAWGFY